MNVASTNDSMSGPLDWIDGELQALETAGLRINGIVVNRIHPEFGAEAPAPAAPAPGGDPEAARQLGELYANLADFVQLSQRERAHLEGLERSMAELPGGHPRTPGVPIVRVPLLEIEVCDLHSLGQVGHYLLGDASNATAGAG